MTYEEARAFLETTKQYGSVLGLDSIINLMDKLSNVQEKLSVIHVAGTNGKGSTCTFIAGILSEAGYRVGRYSSPAVFDYEEIYQINGASIDRADYASCMEPVRAACEQMVAEGKPHPTSFEIETALAFVYFAGKKCDIVVLETGMGGATDATNLISAPVCSVLTDISRDHMGFLGDSLEEIARVKAGIIKENCPVVTVHQQADVMGVIEAQANRLNAKLVVPDDDRIRSVTCDVDEMEIVCRKAENSPFAGRRTQSEELQLRLGLSGIYQVRNAMLALTVAETLRNCGYIIDDTHILAGMANAKWPGRFETICNKPRIVIDGAHNEGAAEKLAESIENYFTNQPITYIIGVLADKEHEKMLQRLLPYAHKVYTITPDNPRALAGELLAAEAKRYHPDVTCMDSVELAVREAVTGAAENEVILAFGSLSYLKQVKEALRMETL